VIGHIKLLSIAQTGGGKTFLAHTFPRIYSMSTEPGGSDTWMYNQKLKGNVVVHKEFLPTSPSDTKRVFEEMQASFIEARKMALEKKIDTLVLDNLTYAMENRWIYINEYQRLTSPKTGELDTRGMYGILGRWGYQWVMMNCTSFPGNVVVTVHEKMESDEAMEKKTTQDYPVVPSILGGFRDDLPGLFSCVFYLTCQKDATGVYHYFARTRPGKGKLAKNRYNLPEIIENVSYDTIAKAMGESIK
jgi:hypothetical protein